MRNLRRLIGLGSARASRALFGALAKSFFLSSRWRGRHRQHARARALPGFLRIALVIGIAGFLAIASLVFWPMPRSLDEPLLGTATLLDVRGREIAQLPSPEARVQLPRKLNELGEWLPRVTVALEDHRFYQHHGVDWRASAAALVRDVKSGRIVSGGSTITQQLAKLARGRQHRSWLGKVDETIVALKLERRWSKERILSEYLNRSSYGNRRLGPEAAARACFGKSARDLNLSETIFLAGIPQAPTRFNPWSHFTAAQKRYARTLARLTQLGVISADQQQLFANAPTISHFNPPHLARHFVDAVVASHRGAGGTLRTTLDLDLQKAAELLLRDHLSALNRYDVSQAALVIVENETGAVRAMVGSSDYTTAQTNGATIPRSCGSTLKPFLYLNALDRHLLTAATILPDTAEAIREEYADYDPQNYNGHYLGPVRMREALACSLNVPAVYTVSQLGARHTFFELQKWGFDFPRKLRDYGAGFILGNAEIRLVDLAGAYAGLARQGVASRAKLLAADHHPLNRVASREASAIICDILCDNVAREKTFGAESPLAFDQRIAVKTGTSSGFRDNWTVGFNKRHTVAVWVGNFNGHPMRDSFAVRSAAPLWSMVMREMLRRGDEPLDFPEENKTLVRRQVCADTGLLPSPQTRATVNEWFLRGTEPTRHASEEFSADGKLILPNEYGGWCKSGDNTRGAIVCAEPRITSPVANAHFSIDPVLPASQQMIELTATLGGDVRWFINGQPLPTQRDGRTFWPLTPGEWKIRAVTDRATIEQHVAVE